MSGNEIELNLQVPEQIGWNVLAWIFGDAIAEEAREYSDDIDRWESDGGQCIG